LNLNGCGPAHHPLRVLKRPINVVLGKRSLRFEERCAEPAHFALWERPRGEAPQKRVLLRRSRGSDRHKARECGGWFKNFAPIGGEPTDRGAGSGFLPATGHLEGSRGGRSLQTQLGWLQADAASSGTPAPGPGWNWGLQRCVWSGPQKVLSFVGSRNGAAGLRARCYSSTAAASWRTPKRFAISRAPCGVAAAYGGRRLADVLSGRPVLR